MKKTNAIPGRRSPQTDRRFSLWFWLGLAGLVLVAGLGAAFFWYQSSASATTTEITTAAAYTRYQQGADLFLDVRTPEEWAQFHLQNSLLIPLAELPNRLNELPRDRNIVIVCRTGNRSLQAQGILQQAGFAQAVSMMGGLTGWQAAGYPVITEP